jgi:hypothetical protein
VGAPSEHTGSPLHPLVSDDELLLAIAPLVADPGTTEAVSIRNEVANLLDPTLLLGLGAHPGELGQSVFFGQAVIGGSDSLGRGLYDAVDGAFSPRLVVTSRRLLIADVRTTPRRSGWLGRLLGPVDQSAQSVFEADRRMLKGVALAPAGVLRRGRFLVAFADGSVCALVCAVPQHARRAVALLAPVQAE